MSLPRYLIIPTGDAVREFVRALPNDSCAGEWAESLLENFVECTGDWNDATDNILAEINFQLDGFTGEEGFSVTDAKAAMVNLGKAFYSLIDLNQPFGGQYDTSFPYLFDRMIGEDIILEHVEHARAE